MFVDSANFIVSTCNMKNIYISLSTAYRNSKVAPVVIPIKFWSLPQRVSKIAMHNASNAYRGSSRDCKFVTNLLLVFLKWSQRRSISCTNLIFPVTYIKVGVQYVFKTTCNDGELWKRKALNANFIIGKLTKASFWYQGNDNKRNPSVMLCSHCPINDSSGYCHNTI